MSPRPDVSEERKNQILDVAEDVFAQRGFAQTRMDDIVEASGLSKGAIYWYFRKKDDLIAGLLARVFRRSLDDVAKAAKGAGSAPDRLRAIAERVAAEYQALSRLAPIAVDFYALALRNRGVQQFIASMYARYTEILTEVVREGVRQGEFRRDLDVEQTVTTFVALFEGLGLVWAIDTRRIRWDRTPQAAFDIIIRGMTT